jgi:hypothetical protein
LPEVSGKLHFTDAVLRRDEGRIPQDVWVIAFDPAAVITVTGRASVSPVLIAEDPKLLSRLDPDGRGFVVLRDFWWHTGGAVVERTEQLLRERYVWTELDEQWEDGFSLTLDRLAPKARR